jgi:hypothetical protein
MSRTFSTRKGSGDSLIGSLRCGCKPKARQMRLIVIRLRPLALASSRVLQCVCPLGVLSRVWITICSVWSSANLALRAWSGIVIQPFQTSLQKTGTPFTYHPFRAAEFLSRNLIVQTFRRQAPRGRAWQATVDCARGASSIPGAAVPLRSVLKAFWASSPHPRSPSDLIRRSARLAHTFLGQDTRCLTFLQRWCVSSQSLFPLFIKDH